MGSATVLYAVRYRKTIGNDDEKEEEWKEQELGQNTDSTVINGLQSESEYEICGRYHEKKTSIWSETSKMVSFTTLKGSKSFQWDSARCHNNLLLSNGNKTVTHNGNNSKWFSVYSKNSISTATTSSFKFEITMKGKGCNGNMHIGIMDEKHIESANTANWIGNQQHQMAVEIWDNGNPRRYINGNCSEIQSNRVDWNVGDRLRLDFDLKGRRCTAFLNDQFLGSLTANLPDTFYLGVSAYH